MQVGTGKKICQVRDMMKETIREGQQQDTQEKRYASTTGYDLLRRISIPEHQNQVRFHYTSFIWNRLSIPKHCFVLRLCVHQKLLTKDRLINWIDLVHNDMCVLCAQDRESHRHLFLDYSYSKEVLGRICLAFEIGNCPTEMRAWQRWVVHLKHSRDVFV